MVSIDIETGKKYISIKQVVILCLLFLFLGFLLGKVLFVARMDFYDKPDSFAPTQVINESNILVFPDQVVLVINNSHLTRYANSGSMIPLLNENAYGVEVVVKNEKDISIGDLVAYWKYDCEKNPCTKDQSDSNFMIIHRVIEIGIDDVGYYFITKGDNNKYDDGKIRFAQIRYKTVAIIY